MVAVVIGMLILTIAIAAVAPALGTIGKRDREQELIFRGKQYARAIALFQRRFGRYPNTLKELYENNPRTIRKLWKDPMCNCADWHLLIFELARRNPQAPAWRAPAAPAPAGRPDPTPTPTPGFGAVRQHPRPSVPIVGVRSEGPQGSPDRNGGARRYYDEWRFIVGDADRDGTRRLRSEHPAGGRDRRPAATATPVR